MQKRASQIFLDPIQKRASSRSVQLEAMLLKALLYIVSAKRSLENICNSFLIQVYVLSIVQIQQDRLDMAWTIKVLVILIITTAMAEKLSLPPVKFLEDFATKYQRTSIVMNLPKDISHNQVLKR